MNAARPDGMEMRFPGAQRGGLEVELAGLLADMGDEVAQSVKAFTAILRTSAPAADPAARIERIAALEQARAVLAAAQLAEEVAFAEQQRAEQLASGVPASKLGRGIAEQIGFARRISPVAASRHVGLAVTLRDRLPEAFKQLWAGAVSEDQCAILANRTSHLTDTDA
ncbi:DUF222 domain-containing protein, partial [Nakamurella lactea]|uniref:DUF222 domain-containing protein n=1 Tax=Nakamurella lactea TaxID=459515 RepID=UPI0013770E5B